MIRLSGLNSVRMRGVWLLATIGFMIVLIVITPSIAAPIETSTTILSDIGAVRVDETIHFTVWVFAGFDPVPTGPVRITDTNTSEYIDSSILGGKIEVNWTVSEPFIEGIHVFEASYQGFQDFSPSSGICIVHFDDFSPGDSRVTSITVETNSSVVFKNASIQFTVELTIHYRWIFRGGYIYVKNTNLSGTPTIHTYGPLPNYYPGTDPSVMTYSFDYQIPLFSLVGTNFFIAEYTGSLESDTLPCTSELTNVSVMSTGYWIFQSLDKNELNREEETLELNTTVLGDYPVGLELRSYYYIDQLQVFFENQTLTSRNASAFFSPNSSVPVGVISIITELVDPSTEFQYANSTEIISIVDRARVEHTENATEFRHNETIRLEVYITEEDVHTHPVVCDVEFIDVTDGNCSLLNKTTNQDGFVIIDYLIPDNSTVGSHEFSLRTYSSNVFIIDIVETFPITIKGLTEIDLTFESGGVDRNSVTVIEVTVLSGGTAISDGLVSLEFAINDSVIETKACEPGLEFNYFLEPAYPLGVMNYQVRFFGSPNYDEQVELFDLTVFSNPTFNTTGQNASEVIKGHTVRIWGQLVDEIGFPVMYEEVELTDTTIGMFLGTSVTDDQGMFFYDYLISATTQIGVHFVEIAYLGNIFDFYHQSTNYPVMSITVRPPLSVMIGSEVVAEYWTIITLEGGLNDEIVLEWQKSGETTWTFFGMVVLNSTGQGNYNWSTPYYKGDFTIRAIGPNSTKYDFSSMYVISKILVSGDAFGNVNDLYSFTVNCTEQYQIWIGGQLWQDWRGAGVHQYEYIFTDRGSKEIVIISNETYVYYQEFHYALAVYEEVIVTISVPLEAPVNVTVNIDGTVNGEVSGPIQGLDAFLVVNGTETQVDSTNGGGNFYFSLVFDTPGCYSLLGKTFLDVVNFYFSGNSEESIIQINSIPPNVQLLSPQNQTYGAHVEIAISGDAQTFWYRIDPIDITNLTWDSPVNRTLIEGNYTCHVCGENEYGVVTSAYANFTVDTTPPSLILINPENNTYTSHDILLSYSTDGSEVLVFLDDVNLGALSSGTNLVVLEGNHNLTIWTQDSVYNEITTTVIFSVDTIPPIVVIDSPLTGIHGTESINVALSGNANHFWYHIEPVDTLNQTWTTSVSRTLLNGLYTLHAYGNDSVGNTVYTFVTFSIDLIPPTLTIDSPLAVIYGTEIISVSLSGNADHFWYYIEPVDSQNQTWTTSVNRTLDNGTYILYALANDSVGNTAKVSVEFSIDTTLPSIIIDSPLAMTYGTEIVSVALSGDASQYWYYIEPLDDQNQTWTDNVYRTLSDGQYTLHAYANDSVGNIAYMFISFQIDTIPPVLSINSPLEQVYGTEVITVSFSGDASHYWYFIEPVDGQNQSWINSETRTLPTGSYTLHSYSNDSVGNTAHTFVTFSIDTTPPLIIVTSPVSQVYGTKTINVTISGDASHFWYSLDPVDTQNQTWTTSVSRTLLNGLYTLHAYGNDSIGNTFHVSVTFTVDIILPTVRILSPLNQTYTGNIIISLNSSGSTTLFYIPGIHSVNQTYSESVTLNLSSGHYLLHVYTFNEDDDVICTSVEFSIISPPVFESISITWDSPFYEIRAHLDSGSISKDMVNVKVYINGTFYSLDYDNNPLVKSWTLSLSLPPQNTTIRFYAWYSWDDNSSIVEDHDIFWFAPTIINEAFSSGRNNFTINIRIEEQNASIDTQSVLLFVDNGSINISDSGILVYESLFGKYQEWRFSASDLPPSVWDYYIQVIDIYGAIQTYRGTYNNSDFPPFFGSYSSSLISKYSLGELWRIEVPVDDDFEVDNVFLFVDGVSNTVISQNGSHYLFEVWLSEGPHHLQLVAHDDIDQVSMLLLPSINVVINNSSTASTSATIATGTPPQSTFTSSNTTTQSVANGGGDTNDLIELGVAGSIFAGLITVGNIVNRKRVK